MDRPNDLLVIGRFARLTGLTVGALRHYDDLDLLRPARVDPGTGYRSYRRDQLDIARTGARGHDHHRDQERDRAADHRASARLVSARRGRPGRTAAP